MALTATVAQVLAGHASYDELDARAQATVRLAEDTARLDMTESLRAPAVHGQKPDDDGNVVWRDPGPPARG